MSYPELTAEPDLEDLENNEGLVMIAKAYPNNRRKSIRYIRSDIGVTLRKMSLINLMRPELRDIPVKLVDISSRGISVVTTMHLSLNKKVVMKIRFSDFKEFEIPGKVVHNTAQQKTIYGIEFERPQDKLANYLLQTQRKLTFR